MLTQNRLLDSLPEALRDDLVSRLEPVSLPVQTQLFSPQEEPRFVHFLTAGVASVVTAMEGGEGIEVGLIGREGFPERVRVLGPQQSNTRCIMQVDGEGLRMPFRLFRELFVQHPPLMTAVHHFVQADSLMLAQLSACNRLHEVEARLARWLLMVQDRVGFNELHLTQEFLGEMLGTRRSTVNLAAGTLQRAGVITYERGRICIENRSGLEDVACECYAVAARSLRSLYA